MLFSEYIMSFSLVVCPFVMCRHLQQEQWSVTTSSCRFIRPATSFLQTGLHLSSSFLPLFHLLLCPDRKYLLVKTSNQRVWRRSSFGDYGLLRMARDGRPASSTVTNLLINIKLEDKMTCIVSGDKLEPT